MIDFLPHDVNKQLVNLDLIVKSSRSVPEIPQILNRTVLLGGKRLRPTLCFLMGKILGVEPSRMAAFARAAEFTHSASLAHDDVLDNANQRRQRKTLNAETSNARAVLAGDMLLARVMVELSEEGNVDIIHDLALVVEDLVSGEWLQLDARGRIDVTWDHLLEVAQRKTASLMSWCCTVAARLSPVSTPELLEACRAFGKNLGIAFQMIDDIIDYEELGGKDYSKDFKEGLMNFVIADMLKNNPQLKVALANHLGQGFDDEPWARAQLEASKENIRVQSKMYLDMAEEGFETIKRFSNNDSVDCVQSIEGLLEFLRMRKL